ncbi:uncharacterized protein [Nicotiana tomentosiformis]|uniref:uncharacterized protein n=1 Tax=Nicotiana tomentosiformis TaxID=4098 RepID=UPI00388CEAAF
MVGKKALLRVFPMKGVMLFGEKGKLSPWFINPFEILERVGDVAYRFSNLPSIVGVHMIFHISMLRKYHENRSYVLDFSTVQLDENLTYEEELVDIKYRQIRKLRSQSFPYVKVQWSGQPIEEGRWESETEMRSRYPNLFASLGTFLYPFKDELFF